MTAEILTVAECYAADRHAAACGVQSLELMENAGRAVADCATDRFPSRRIRVLCGPGNNGGDGFVAARLLSERGNEVRLALLGERHSLRGDAASMAARWQGSIELLSAEFVSGAELVVDALFGAGLSRPLEGIARDCAAKLNALGTPVIAVDVPSGLSGDTGRPPDDGDCIHAEATVTFFRPKPAHVLMPGRMFCGEVIVADIGIPESAIEKIKPRLFENGPPLWGDLFPWPSPLAHKYARGHAVVVSGPLHTTGAARLAARAALRAGAGLVSVASPPDAVAINAASLTAVMVKPFAGAQGLSALLQDSRFNAVGLGPGSGVGRATAELVAAALESEAGAVLDADALTSFQSEPAALFRLLRNPCVLTPHAGEFERIFPGFLGRSASRIEAVRAAAAAAGAVVLLKGPDTAIADTIGRTAVNTNAPAWLATAGAGDVLTGIITGMFAQGMPAFEAACIGAWLHGEAAGLVGPGLISEDLPDMLPAVLRALAESLDRP